MLPRRLRVALIQYDCPDEKPAALASLDRLVRAAARSQPDLVLLAETPFTPYTTMRAAATLAEPIPGPFSDRLSALAKEHRLHLCSGTVEREEQEIYNTALLFGPDGTLLHAHRKCHLAPTDLALGFSPGSGVSVVETALGRIGLLICLDTDDRALVQAMARARPDLLLVPAYGLAKFDYRHPQPIDGMVDECIEEWRLRMQMLAKWTKSYVLRADHCGVEGAQVRVGHSLAVSPAGYVLAEATMKPAVLEVELDPAGLHQQPW